MTDFQTMLDFFSPETDYVYTFCAECGVPLSVHKQGVKRPLCEDCKREAQRERDHTKYVKKHDPTLYHRFGDPTVDLVSAVLRQAEHDAAQFLVAHDGAELWLKCVGIGVTNQMRRKLELLAIGAE